MTSIPYPFTALGSILIFSAVHLWADRTRELSRSFQGKLLSLGGGVSISYVFIDLLPALCKSDVTVRQALSGIFPYFERHVYIMALIGFILFFLVDRSQKYQEKPAFWLSLFSYSLFNFLVGYSVTDKNDPDIQPLALFTLAMSLHYFVNDYSLSDAHGKQYTRFGKWLLIAPLFVGWAVGLWITVPATAVALMGAFIAGGVIMNVIRHELPEENPHSTASFILSAALYTAILLFIGSS